ncbi:MAG: hypothetical protein EON58_05590 [Alphaproteobacteria bacterium]|nr:MAG: hypothetical protein EON58_05590 [Alphaproteobacteria bacterium]
MAAALIGIVASTNDAARPADFVDVQRSCELEHLWKQPPKTRAFDYCMKEGNYYLHFSPTCQLGSRRERCYDLREPKPPL